MRTQIIRKTAIAALLFTLAVPASSRAFGGAADTRNLSSARGTRATASANITEEIPPSFVLRQAYGEIRFRNDYGDCWWMAELPAEYTVSSVAVEFRAVIKSVGFKVKLSDKALDEAQWQAVAPASDFMGILEEDTNSQRTRAQCSFSPAKARFVRLEFYGHNGSETGGAGKDHPDLVVSNVAIIGIPPSDDALLPISSSARCYIKDITKSQPEFSPALSDEGKPFAGNHVKFWTGGTDSEPPKETCKIDIVLDGRYEVQAVAWSSVVRTRDDKDWPRDVKIFLSPHSIGDSWKLASEKNDIPRGEYEEIEFPQPLPAARLRIEIPRVWNTKISNDTGASFGHLGEVYVFGKSLPPDFSIKLETRAFVSARILGDGEKQARILFEAKKLDPGVHGFYWDGLDDSGTALPPGQYSYTAYVNQSKYSNPGAIGNNAVPSTHNLNPSNIEGIAVDGNGDIFTANMWEEQGQDFRKVSAKDGSHIFNAKYAIRGSNPDAMAYAITLDDKYIYCATSSHVDSSAQHVRRFSAADGKPAPFPSRKDSHGHIFFYKSPEKHIPENASQTMRDILILPLRAIAVVKDKLYVGDSINNLVHIFDKDTGAPAGSFKIDRPHAMAVDSKGQLWIASDGSKIILRKSDGSLSTQIDHPGLARAIAFDKSDRLFVADTENAEIRIYQTDPAPGSAKLARRFGGRAKPGESGPDRFYKLTGIAADPQGNFVISQGFPITGSRLTRFAPDGKAIWDQIGAEFCSTGNYSQERPDELISHYFNRYLLDRSNNSWKFDGFVLDGDSRYPWQQHGVMRILKLNNTEFLFQSYGDGLQVYRRQDNGTFRLASMFGIKNPMPDGRHWDYIPGEHGEKLEKYPPGLWSWSDLNANGKVEDDEVNWFKKPGENFNLSHFGVNVDKHGNGLICDHHNSSVFEMPMAGFDQKGNPNYDYEMMRQIIPPDLAEKGKRLISQPLMAMRADDGSIYVHSRSDLHPVPSGHSWTCGWMLARYDKDGKLLWWRKLPEACPGMDVIPGENAGVMLASFQWKEHGCDVFHYSADGLLIGITRPAPEFLGFGGIPDNVASLVVNRDPRDGILDLFVEDCIGNRFHWHRVEDKNKITEKTGKVVLK